jgi:hypothetical protein
LIHKVSWVYLTFFEYDEFYDEEGEHEEVLPCRRCAEQAA